MGGIVRNLTTHLLWIVAILVGVISILLWRLPNGSQLSGYISFAASIASLVLAIVAIFQSLLSSQGMGASISEIKLSAQAVADETERLSQASIGLHDAAAALKKLDDIPDQLTAMKGELSGQIEKIDAQKLSKLSPDNDSHDGSADKWYEGRPIGYILAFYALALTNQSGNPLNLDNVFSDPYYSSIKNYINGVVVTVKYHCVFQIEVDGINEFIATSMGICDAGRVINDVREFNGLSLPIRKVIRTLNEHYKLEWLPSIEDDVSGGE